MMFIRKTMFSLCLMSALSIAPLLVASESKVSQPNSVCEDPLMIVALNYPPFFDDTEDSGYELKNAVADAFALHGCRSVIAHMPFARALQLAKMGKVDAMLSTWYRPEREAFLHYGPELFNAYNVLATLDKPEAPTSIAHIDGLRLGIVRGYALPTNLDLSGVQMVYTKDDRTSVAMLHKGRVDLVFINAAQLSYWPTTDVVQGELKLRALPGSEQDEGFYFAVTHKRDDHKVINRYLSDGLASLNWDGKQFVAQYLPESVSENALNPVAQCKIENSNTDLHITEQWHEVSSPRE